MSNEQQLIDLIKYFIKNNKITTRGHWLPLVPNEIEIGIGNHLGLPAIADNDYHIDLDNSHLVIHDKHADYKIISADEMLYRNILAKFIARIPSSILETVAQDNATLRMLTTYFSNLWSSSSSSSSSSQSNTVVTLSDEDLVDIQLLKQKLKKLEADLQKANEKLDKARASRDYSQMNQIGTTIRNIKDYLKECSEEIKALCENSDVDLAEMIRDKCHPRISSSDEQMTAHTISCTYHKDMGEIHIHFNGFHGPSPKDLFRPFIENYRFEIQAERPGYYFKDYLFIIDPKDRQKLYDGLRLSETGSKMNDVDRYTSMGFEMKC